jgi:taurine dioxygenase
MKPNYRTIDVRPLASAIGAEILGVDLALLNDEQFSEIRQAYYDYSVIFFRDQTLTPEQHVAFARRWGEINVNRFFKPVDGYPMIAQVLKEPEQQKNIGGNWHTDHSYDLVPAMGSILYAKEVPATGGDTQFASMYRAYETLSDGMKQMLSGLKALHSSRHVFGPGRYERDTDLKGRLGNSELAQQDAVHPVVLTHPQSGRKSLYVNPGFTVRIDGWTDEESKPLLEYLYQHAVKPEFVCRFQWKKGSIAFWDNRATWHYALNDYQGQRRYMHRITVEGVPLH